MTSNELRRESVIKDVTAIFIDVIGFLTDDEKKMVNGRTHIIKDFNVDGDDATEVGMALEKHFSVKPTLEEWGKVALIYEIADLIIKHLDKKS